MVGLEGVEDVLLAVEGAACPLLICHCGSKKEEERLPISKPVTSNVHLSPVPGTRQIKDIFYYLNSTVIFMERGEDTGAYNFQ